MHLPGVTSWGGITSPSNVPWFSSHILDSLPAYSTRTCVTMMPVSRLSHRTRSHHPVVPTAAPRHDPRLLLALSTGLRGIRSQPPSSLVRVTPDPGPDSAWTSVQPVPLTRFLPIVHKLSQKLGLSSLKVGVDTTERRSPLQ